MSRTMKRCSECKEPHDGYDDRCGDCIIDEVMSRFSVKRPSEPIEPVDNDPGDE